MSKLTKTLLDASESLSTQQTHTPGPWQQSEDQKAAVNCVFQGVWIKQGHMTLADVFTDIPEGAANARLIASAPELLSALETCLAAITDPRIGKWTYMEGSDIYADFDKAAIQSRAAIARATQP